MKVVIAADSMKGSLSSEQVNSVICGAVKAVAPSAEIQMFSFSDGGEGFLSALNGVGDFAVVQFPSTDAVGAPYTDTYLWDVQSCTAIFESATSLSLVRMSAQGLLTNWLPAHSSSRPLGIGINHALANGARTIAIGLGGTCTTDGGTGMLLELGARVWDADGNLLPMDPTSNPLLWPIHRIELPDLTVSLVGLADVRSPLLGLDGAAYMFGPQKGADPGTVEKLEFHMQQYANALVRAGMDVQRLPSAGAAGGLGAAVLALGGRIMSGVDYLAARNGFVAAAANADYVFLAEGQFDQQSLYGKTPTRLAQIARWVGAAHTVILTGSNALPSTIRLPHYIDQVIEIHPPTIELDTAMDPQITARALTKAVQRTLLGHP